MLILKVRYCLATSHSTVIVDKELATNHRLVPDILARIHIMLEIGLCLRKEILQSPTEQEYNTEIM